MSHQTRTEDVVNTPTEATRKGPVEKLGLSAGQVVQEFGYDDDVDDEFRFAVEDVVGSELEDEDYSGVADAVLLWWREEDGDLTDRLVDVLATLAEGAPIALLSPKPGRPGEVDPSEVEEAALTAGLHASGNLNAGTDWTGTKLVAPKTGRR